MKRLLRKARAVSNPSEPPAELVEYSSALSTQQNFNFRNVKLTDALSRVPLRDENPQMNFKVSINLAILSIIALGGAIMIALAGTSFFSHQIRDDVQKEVATIEELFITLDELRIDFLMARRSEKDFLLRRDESYVEKHAAIITTMHAHIEHAEMLMKTHPELGGQRTALEQITTSIDGYAAAFLGLVSSNLKLGLDENSGLEGQLRTAVRDVEGELNELNEPEMQVKMLMMRRHEKDFIMRKASKYLDRLNARVEEFMTFPESYYASAEQEAAIKALIATYQQSFAAFVDETLREDGLRGEVSTYYAEAEPVLEQVHADVRGILEETVAESTVLSQEIQRISLQAGIAGGVVFVLVALLLARGISRPLKQIDLVLKRMINADFSPKIPTSRIHELSAISHAVASFRANEETKHQLTQEISTVISACAEGDFSKRVTVSKDGGTFAELGQGVNTIGEVAQKGLGDVQKVLAALSKGDLNQAMPKGHKGIFQDIANDIDHLTESLNGMMSKLTSSSSMLHNTAAEISAAVDDASRRGETTAASLEETAAALQTVSDTVRGTAKSAQETRDIVNSAQSNAENTRDVAKNTVAAMHRIKESSDAISKITGMIDDVAFQTNLLALNAGVEAARAGEAGRGFAVVASEVRALAQKSSDAAREINSLIATSTSEVTSGVDLVDETGSALETIVQAIQLVVEKANIIAENTVDQSNGLSEVNVAVEALDSNTQKGAAMLEETAAAGQLLRQEADNLLTAISGFRLKDHSKGGTAGSAVSNDSWAA